MEFTAGRLRVQVYEEGDQATLIQTHRNGSSEEVGRIELEGDELEDALYVLNRVKKKRDG